MIVGCYRGAVACKNKTECYIISSIRNCGYSVTNSRFSSVQEGRGLSSTVHRCGSQGPECGSCAGPSDSRERPLKVLNVSLLISLAPWFADEVRIL